MAVVSSGLSSEQIGILNFPKFFKDSTEVRSMKHLFETMTRNIPFHHNIHFIVF